MYIFLDESGKPEVYSAKGKNLVRSNQASKFLVISAIRADDQLELQQKVTKFRSELLSDRELRTIFSSAYTLDAFHANKDYPEVMERFYFFITGLELKIDVIAVDKLKCFTPLQINPSKLYSVMAGQLLKNVCHLSENTEVIFSRKDSKLKLQKELEAEVERARLNYLEKHTNINASFKLSYFHNPHYTHGGLQVADYISYAVFKVFEDNERRWFDLVADKIGMIHDICNKKYYTRRNPL